MREGIAQRDARDRLLDRRRSLNFARAVWRTGGHAGQILLRACVAEQQGYFLPLAAWTAWAAWAAFSYLRWKRSTRPAVSMSFCLPVKNGWQFEQISTRIRFALYVERVLNALPQAQ